MSGWRYAWLIAVCAVIAPVTGGLLLAVPIGALQSRTLADFLAGLALFGGVALVAGAAPGFASGLVLALLRHFRGQLSLPVVVAVVLVSLVIFATMIEFLASGSEHTMEGFLGSMAVMAFPALLAIIAIWRLRGKLGLGALG